MSDSLTTGTRPVASARKIVNKVLFSFGTINYYLSLIKLGNSASIYVNRSIMLTEYDIPREFYNDNASHFKDPRGFGYWVWKSYFINKFLESATENDVFLYVDAGNEIIADLTPIYDLCAGDERGIILFDNRDAEPSGNVWKNSLWTKSDCFNLMGLRTEEYIHGNQVNASYIVFRRTEFSVEFFSTFLNLCKNYNIVSDSPNITENFNTEFRDHRHDQSILSLLSIKHLMTIKRDPSQRGDQNSEYGQLFNHHRRKYLIRF